MYNRYIVFGNYALTDPGGGYCGYRLIGHEQNQNRQIYELSKQVALLNEQAKGSDRAESFKTKQGYHYLAIGNSITLHGITDYWWGEWGMAASTEKSDYVNIVTSFLKDKGDNEVVNAAYNYSVWEIQSHDRAQTWEFLDYYLFPGIDLITVQLSENCSDIATFQSDFRALINHVKEKCGEDLQIIVIDDFWDHDKGGMKKQCVKKWALHL